MAWQLMWFRSDLRTSDNTALSRAAAKGPVIAVFLRSLPQWQGHGHGANKLSFWGRGVEALRDELRGLNIPLLHRDIDDFDDAPETLLAIARVFDIEALHFNREYPLNECRRDEAVTRAFQHQGIRVHAYTDAVAYEPGELLTEQGDFYSVFTPFSRTWHRQMAPERLALHDTPRPQRNTGISNDPLPPLPRLADIPVGSHQWPAGPEAAADRLERFLHYRAHCYQSQRNFPAVDGTSELSPYLALGMISYRQCMQAVLNHNNGSLGEGDAGLVSWVNELVWREFYQHIVVGFPDVCRHRPFQPDTERLRWRNDPDALQAWREGRTGYPIVDAAMRQLTRTGWMHNRLRMITAMFLSKHLLIDWRHGEAFFLRHLVDGEFAANNGGWQWAASTGTDAAPYFRIFNPTTQSQRFDPEGHFIARFVPELSNIDGKRRHAPTPDLLASVDYPAPIVNHQSARQRALDAFKSLKT
ncbi:deoxyribodipyrimidine photo-lyase [Aidingimonas halophila]|uniref:Deoxyribodipyrimidine photo-lyase n=1 Tax=Aidingimonas halophila TaxID=574349 RepID=A0A1H3HLR4_9GAMM|nr:deoxyribodipyrimidine photo-lyase [Aidingimonas halophila]GHC37167.1 deoxyribodipyrimidine photo-lyase [Aidingimonas halophila]SDY15734.1 deoxyribodipyrimidine photo-lyase type I [Aidingimonas halophila]